MPDIPIRNRPIRQLATTVMLASLVVGFAFMVTGFIVWIGPANDFNGGLLVAAGCALIALCLILHASILILLKAEANIHRLHETTLEIAHDLRRLVPLAKATSDAIQISDAVRSITHREMEKEALRQAIRDEMYRGDWEATYYLINEMERRFGHKQEAQNLREEMATVREMTIEEKIGEAISRIEKVINDHHWDRAAREIERLMKLFPSHDRVRSLPGELNRRRNARKQELLAAWNQAVQRNEIDQGIAILTELDSYLAPTEATELHESARGVFKARLLNLGVQFGLAVSESRWRDALEVGLQIRQEFPNSRMAQEVAGRLEILRVRAGYAANADVVQQRNPEAEGSGATTENSRP